MGRAFGKVVCSGYGAGRWLRNLLVAGIVIAGPVNAETVTVAALGDSLTQGYGLPPEDGFVPQMEAWLKRQGADVVLINAGVSGDTTAGGLSRVAWTLTPDVDAMILALGGNDLLRGIDPANSRENLKGILEAAQAAGIRVLLVGLPGPTNYGPDYKAAFDAMYPELSAEFGTALFPDWFQGLVDLGDPELVRQTYFQPDGIHPNAEGVKLIVGALGPAVLALVQGE
jgi:acyl-CoA thioesterase I